MSQFQNYKTLLDYLLGTTTGEPGEPDRRTERRIRSSFTLWIIGFRRNKETIKAEISKFAEEIAVAILAALNFSSAPISDETQPIIKVVLRKYYRACFEDALNTELGGGQDLVKSNAIRNEIFLMNSLRTQAIRDNKADIKLWKRLHAEEDDFVNQVLTILNDQETFEDYDDDASMPADDCTSSTPAMQQLVSSMQQLVSSMPAEPLNTASSSSKPNMDAADADAAPTTAITT